MSSNNDGKASSSRNLTNWIWSGSEAQSQKDESNEDGSDKVSDIIRHRKQLAQILRYIATMHHSLGSFLPTGDNPGNASGTVTKRGNNGHSFVRKARNPQVYWQSSFYQGMRTPGTDERFGVLLSTQNFRQMLAIQADSSMALFESPPFSFYAATTGQSPTAANRKRAWADAFKNPLKSSSNGKDGKACWLRLTRLTSSDVPEPPSIASGAVRRYLQQWRDQNEDEFRHCETLREMLTLKTLAKAPKIAPMMDSAQAEEIKIFLRDYKQYLRKRAFQQTLEPMYNDLFEWAQETETHLAELVFGLGHAKMMTGDRTVVNGPLLEILVEVELARDGALLVRPREHTGVALNREVVSALMVTDDASVASGSSSNQQRLTQLHRYIAELDPLQMAPGQPSTYISVLKRLTVELSSRGTFHISGNVSPRSPATNKMLVTEAWCLYSRPKPSSVWARDAMAFADQLILPSNSSLGLELPKAAWALTHGPGSLEKLIDAPKEDQSLQNSESLVARLLTGQLFKSTTVHEPKSEAQPILFSLPTSDSQSRIADLLLRQNYPAILVEGPPGSGKTHTIVNMISACLCKGMRILVTSKSAPALSVIRSRLPKCIQDLCVDVSMSELAGMRQLQKTVERLANRVSGVSADIEAEKCHLLLRNIEALEKERAEIDKKLAALSDSKRKLIQSSEGQKLVSGLTKLIEKAPWLMKSISKWSDEELTILHNKLTNFVSEQDESMERVFLSEDALQADGIDSIVAAKAGVTMSHIKQASKKLFASIPVLGSALGLQKDATKLEEQVASITVDGKAPGNQADWKQVLHVLRFEKAIDSFHQIKISTLLEQENWPEIAIYKRVGPNKQQRIIRRDLVEIMEEVVQLKDIAKRLEIPKEIESAIESNELDARRSLIGAQIQRLAEDLVDATVITQLSRSFSADAQSALIRFSQIAGKAKFSRSSQPSKMTARQRRHRREYLDAFDTCVRYIPTWIMTSSQISDYLPAECLFDLVIVDEASQSDITVLPGMLRGKQWLVVGDGKQVSPTESFISEDSIDSLRAALPRSPLEDAFLPGQSFFDLCAQAYPRGRVVLSEHFRCAPEIINFSNQQFYDGRLVPLRLPTCKERLSPSLMDIRVPDGVKNGKVNEKECDEIVRLVHEFITDAAFMCNVTPRSIGVISLLGDDQSRLIRGRLLDRIGPQKFKEHNILVGDPPTFQGAERDIVYLSMVCSPGSVPTQNRLMHAQRINVALSRARDRMVLVRSIDVNHIPNNEDIKLPVIEFFEEATNIANAGDKKDKEDHDQEERSRRRTETTSHSIRIRAEQLLESFLKTRGFSVRSMGVVWNNGLCVEYAKSNSRAALCIENGGESKEEWLRTLMQQKSIERVGWKCLRVDAISFLADYNTTLEQVISFLAAAGVEEPAIIYDALESEDEEEVNAPADGIMVDAKEQAKENEAAPDEVVVISSDEENSEENHVADLARSSTLAAMGEDKVDASDFGEIVELDFLHGSSHGYSPVEESSLREDRPRKRTRNTTGPRKIDSTEASSTRASRDKAYMGDHSDSEEEVGYRQHSTVRIGSGSAHLKDAQELPIAVKEKQHPNAMEIDNRSETGSASNVVGSTTNNDDDVLNMYDIGMENTNGTKEYGKLSKEKGDFSSEEGSMRSKRQRSYYRRIDKYSRDGRWYPTCANEEENDEQNFMYDTDSDLQAIDRNSAAEENSEEEDEDFRPSQSED